MLMKLTVMICLYSLFVSAFAVGQPADSPFAEDAAHAQWAKFLASGFRLDSAGQVNDFFVDSYSNACLFRGEPSTFRAHVDSRPGQCVLMVLELGVHTAGIIIGDEYFRVGSDEKWARRQYPPWSYAFDAEQIGISIGDPKHAAGSILFAPGEFLQSLMKAPPKEVTWNVETGNLEVYLKRGSRLLVRYRSPSDEKNFGSSVGEVSVISPEGNYFIHRNLVVGRHLFLRLAEFDRDHLATVLEAKDRRSSREPLDQVTLTIGYAEAMYALERVCATRARDDRPFAVEAKRCANEVGMLTYQCRDAARSADESRQREFEQLACQKAAVELRNLVNLSDRRFAAEGCLFVDDCGLRYLGMERLVSFGVAEDIWRYLVRGLVESPHVPIEEKVAIASAAGDLGMPALARLKPIISEGEFSWLFNALLMCRWGVEPTADQLERLQKASQSAESDAVRRAAVDCLVRWGHTDHVPEAAMNDWFESVTQGLSTNRASLWRDLTLTRDGRRFLFEKKELHRNPDLWWEIRPIIRQRPRTRWIVSASK